MRNELTEKDIKKIEGIFYSSDFSAVSSEKSWDLQNNTLHIYTANTKAPYGSDHAVLVYGYSFEGDENSCLRIKSENESVFWYGLAYYGTVNVDTLDIDVTGSAIYNEGEKAANIKAKNVILSGLDGIVATYGNSSVLIEAENLTINSTNNAIYANSNNTSVDIDVTNKLTIISNNHSILSINLNTMPRPDYLHNH